MGDFETEKPAIQSTYGSPRSSHLSSNSAKSVNLIYASSAQKSSSKSTSSLRTPKESIEYYKRYEPEIPVTDYSSSEYATGDNHCPPTLTDSLLERIEQKILSNHSQEHQTESSTSIEDSRLKFFRTTVEEIFDTFYNTVKDIKKFKHRYNDILNKSKIEEIVENEMEIFIKDIMKHIRSHDCLRYHAINKAHDSLKAFKSSEPKKSLKSHENMKGHGDMKSHEIKAHDDKEAKDNVKCNDVLKLYENMITHESIESGKCEIMNPHDSKKSVENMDLDEDLKSQAKVNMKYHDAMKCKDVSNNESMKSYASIESPRKAKQNNYIKTNVNAKPTKSSTGSVIEAYKNSRYLDSDEGSTPKHQKRPNQEVLNIFFLNSSPSVEIRMNHQMLPEVNIKHLYEEESRVTSVGNLKLKQIEERVKEIKNNNSQYEQELIDREIPIKSSMPKKNLYLNEDFDLNSENNEKSFIQKFCSYLCRKLRKAV